MHARIKRERNGGEKEREKGVRELRAIEEQVNI